MDAKELAKLLTGIEYPVRIQTNILAQAKASGLVIVYGGSDDLVEFEGAITDEAGCYGGDAVRFDRKGVIPDFGEVEHEVEECRKWLERDAKAREIDALWCKEAGYSWTYASHLPHATFEVMEDGEHYCRGIVFSLDDLPA
jgi:hypothetical protein